MKIVVADDDDSQRFYLALLLEKMGHMPIEARDGNEAIAALEEHEAAVIVCDLEMPSLDGLDVMRIIRERRYERYIYAILLTGHDQTSAYIEGLAAGADDFMAKPVKPRTLAARLQAATRLIGYDANLRHTQTSLEQANREITDGLTAAYEAQRSLLPSETDPILDLEISSLYRPAHYVSGDMFSIFPLTDQSAGFYAVDVAGHGMRAALRAVTLAHTITNQFFAEAVGAERYGDQQTFFQPHRLAEALNARFVDQLATDDYFSMLCGVVDCQKSEIVICQAGHPRPLLFGSDGEVRWLGQGGYPVGLLSDAIFTSHNSPFLPGDQLVVYSDGVTEAENRSGEPFGEDRVSCAVRKARESGAPIGAILDTALSQWTPEGRPHDDISILAITRKEAIDV